MTTTPHRSHWGMVLLLAGTATAAYLCRVNITIAGALVMQETGISQVEMGRVFSAMLVGYTLAMLPGGLLADRWGARRTITVVAWGLVAATLLQASAGRLGSAAWWTAGGVVATLVLLRFLMGVFAAPTYPASLQGASRWIPPVSQGRANGLVIGSVGLGSALAPPFISAVMVTWGWRTAMAASAVPAVVFAIVWLFVREPAGATVHPLPSQRASSEPEESSWQAIRRLVRLPGFVLLTLSYSLQGYVGYIFVTWFYLYLVQVRHFDLLQGALFSSLPWVLSIVSIPLGGVISDRLVQGRLGPTWGRRLVPMVGMAGSGVFISIGAHVNEPYVAAVALAVATALVMCVEGPYWATAASLAGTRSGTGGGLMNTGCNIAGSISPLVTPMIGATLGWEPALHVAAGLSVLAAVVWIRITPAPR